MKIRYDEEANAAYVYVDEAALKNGNRARTREIERLMIYTDVDENGRVLGIEFLSIDRFEKYMRDHSGLNPDEVLSVA